MSSAEDPVCVKPELDAKAHPKCAKQFSAYESCAQRVAAGSVEQGKNCSGYYNEYFMCIDKTNAKALFKLLK